MSDDKPVIELTLVGGENLGDLAKFVEVAQSLGLQDSAPALFRLQQVTLRSFLFNVHPAGAQRDPSTGRFVRAVS
jgi:hypothetical protein